MATATTTWAYRKAFVLQLIAEAYQDYNNVRYKQPEPEEPYFEDGRPLPPDEQNGMWVLSIWSEYADGYVPHIRGEDFVATLVDMDRDDQVHYDEDDR